VGAALVLATAALLISNIRYRHFGQHMWPSLPRTLKLLFGILLLIFVNLAVANRHYANSFRIYCFVMACLYAVGGIDYKGDNDDDEEESATEDGES
jgi:uncharacterized membrane protein HdeD (DUF308 family)